MKILRRENQVFSTSFLDVIACGFGAVLALVIIAENKDIDLQTITPPSSVETVKPQAKYSQILLSINQAKKTLKDKTIRHSELQKRLDETRATIIETETELLNLKKKRDVFPPAIIGSIDSKYAGGVPVGRDHIIFVVDTSGSMQVNWQTVVENMKNIMDAHPQVKGLQIMSDNGSYLLSGYRDRWIPDTPAARKRAIEKLENWASLSNSSPALGLERALKVFARKESDVTIFVVGDDFTGSSYQEVIDTVDRWNITSSGGRAAVIHGIGFSWGLSDRFSTLMREVAYQNGGVFVGM
ncbi:VWA domain-containing protein [Gammaproteobacteria bacterium]|nr:VWA domain-containing protein [Gammaproteobacteria bacterium]